jgi:hypothetical protein
MLVMAASASLEIGAWSLYPLGRGFDNALETPTRESRLLLSYFGFNLLTRQDEWNEQSLAGPVLVAREPRQPVAAIDELVDRQLHVGDSKRSETQRTLGTEAFTIPVKSS